MNLSSNLVYDQHNPLIRQTPAEAGFCMPAEWAPHERCWMARPHRSDLWRDAAGTQKAYADVARAIRRFEPVTMLSVRDHADNARRQCGPDIDVMEMDLDDAWVRDSASTFLLNQDGVLAGTNWRFNA